MFKNFRIRKLLPKGSLSKVVAQNFVCDFAFSCLTEWAMNTFLFLLQITQILVGSPTTLLLTVTNRTELIMARKFKIQIISTPFCNTLTLLLFSGHSTSLYNVFMVEMTALFDAFYFQVFDDVAVELTMAILQYFNSKPSEEQLFRCMKALAKFVLISGQEVPQLIQMIGPDPKTFKGTSERIDGLIAQICERIRWFLTGFCTICIFFSRLFLLFVLTCIFGVIFCLCLTM